MERRFEICNNYTKDTIKDFWRFRSKNAKINIAYLKCLIMCGVCLFIALNILNILNPEMDLGNVVSSPLWIFLILLIIIFWIVPYEAVMKYYKNLKDTEGLRNTIVFYNDRISVESAQSKSEYYYSQLYECDENPEYFYIFVRVDLVHIIDKSKFKIGDAAGLRKFLEKEADVKVIQKK